MDNGRSRVSQALSCICHRLAEFFGHDASPHTLITVARTLDTEFVPIPGHLHVAYPNKRIDGPCVLCTVY